MVLYQLQKLYGVEEIVTMLCMVGQELGHAHGLLQGIAWYLPKLTYKNHTPCPQWWFFVKTI